MNRRRTTLAAALFALLGSVLLGSLPAQAAEAFPGGKPVRVIVPYAAGGADSYVRPLTNNLARNHGINLIIESVPGAGGLVGANRVKRSPADGYTLLFAGSGALTVAPKLSNDPLVVADYAAVLNLVAIPYILAVGKDSKLRTAAEFIDFVKRNPGKINYGSAGTGSAPHLAMEAMLLGIGASATHVPYPGIAASVQALLGGHIDAVIGAPSNVMAQVNGGTMVALGVSTKTRFALTPQVPTLTEVGAPVDVTTHFGFLAPKGTPANVVTQLSRAIRDAASDPAFKTTMDSMQTNLLLLGPDEYVRALAAEAAAFEPVIRKLPKQ